MSKRPAQDVDVNTGLTLKLVSGTVFWCLWCDMSCLFEEALLRVTKTRRIRLC